MLTEPCRHLVEYTPGFFSSGFRVFGFLKMVEKPSRGFWSRTPLNAGGQAFRLRFNLLISQNVLLALVDSEVVSLKQVGGVCTRNFSKSSYT